MPKPNAPTGLIVNRDRLEHDQEIYVMGEPIDITDEAQRTALIKLGAIVEVSADDQINFSAGDNSEKIAAEITRIKALIERARELGIANPDLITVESLEAIIVEAENDKINFNNGGNGNEENNNSYGGSAAGTSAAVIDRENNVPASDSSSTVENATATDETNVGAASENVIEGNQSQSEAATLVGGITKDGRIVELKDWKVPDLKKLAIDLEVKNANQLNKDALIAAITAIEFAADQLEP